MPLPVTPEWLSAKSVGRPIGVDRKEKVLRGYVVAQVGPFKSEGRGEFDRQALETIVQMGNAARGGLKSRFTHPGLSSDGLGKFLGRSHHFSLAMTVNAAGEAVDAVRADLHFDPSAEKTPSGDLADYVMTLAESDPNAISSSLVLKTERLFRLNPDGTPQTDADGNELPPLWRPTALHASDIVDTGDAVDGLLSINPTGLPDEIVRRATELLETQFDGQPRDVIESRCLAWLGRYLDAKFGPVDLSGLERHRRRMQKHKIAIDIGLHKK